MKVLIVANACQWASWDDKIAAIKAFWAPLLELDIDIKYTDFANIPTSTSSGVVTTFGPNGTYTDTPGVTVDIEPSWVEQNIFPFASDYDLVVLQIANQTPQEGLPLGFAYGKLQGVSISVSLIASETDNYYLAGNGETMGPLLGNLAEVIIEHEISHELYNLSGQTDNTHKFFYANQFSRVLTDIKLPSQSPLIALYQQLVADLQAELGILKQQQPTADPQTPSETTNLPPQSDTTPETTQPSSSAPSVSDLFNFIKGYEGWAAPGETLNGTPFPNGSISYQCNNPMNAKWASQEYATPRTFEIAARQEIFAAFDTLVHGTAYGMECLTMVVNGTDEVYNVAAHNLGLANSGDLTLNQFFAIRDAASDGNDPDHYAAAAGKQFGVTPATFQMKQFTL